MNKIALRQKEIGSLLSAQKNQIDSLLQDAKKSEKFMAAALVVGSDAALLACTPESVIKSLIDVANLDLNIDKNIGHCYLLAYNDWKTKVTICQLQISYKGFIQLMFRAGWMVKYEEVYKCDTFNSSSDGWKKTIEIVPNIDARDDGDNEWVIQNLRGIYVEARHIDTGHIAQEFVSKNVINKLRLNSPNQKVGQYTKPADKLRLDAGLPVGIWNDWFIEMAIAKAIKRVGKRLPIGDERVMSAITYDDKTDVIESTSTGIVQDDSIIELPVKTALDVVIDYIANSETKEHLLQVDTSALTKEEKDIVRKLYDERSRALYVAKLNIAETVPTSQSWDDRLESAKTKAELDAVIAEMDDVEIFENRAVIEERMDMFS